MGVLPNVLTHNFDPARGPFRNLCTLPEQEAEAVLEDIRRQGFRRPATNYLQRRRAVERWLARESRRKITGIRLVRPVYFFLGDFADGRDRSRPCSILLPLRSVPPEAVTFTYPDSMTSFALASEADLAPLRQAFHGQVMTVAELETVVARHGMPAPRWPRPPGALSDGYIEAQIWDDAPLRRLRTPAPVGSR